MEREYHGNAEPYSSASFPVKISFSLIFFFFFGDQSRRRFEVQPDSDARTLQRKRFMFKSFMDRQILTLIILTLGVFFGFLAVIVESQNHVTNQSPPPPPPPPPTPATHKHSNLAPPKSGSNGIPVNHHNNRTRQHAHEKARPQPNKKNKLNFGKKIGLYFAGIAAILQVCVVSFLVIKRRQILRTENGL